MTNKNMMCDLQTGICDVADEDDIFCLIKMFLP